MDTRAPKKPDAPSAPTPMMEQFLEIKAANPDSLLFYRMGDFFELFFEDAEIASRALGITLTKRGKHIGNDIPMCGVPVHAAEQYLQNLIALGHRVAVCEQTEDPAEAKKRGAKSVVRREVVRLVTPGTLTEDALLAPGRNNYLASLARLRGTGQDGADLFGLAWVDISTGEFRVAETSFARLASDLARIDPRELIVADAVFGDSVLADIFRDCQAAVTPLSAAFFDGATAVDRLTEYFGVKTLDGFGAFRRAELSAAAAALAYVEKTQVKERPPLSPPVGETDAEAMLIDAATRTNLELTTTLAGERQGSLVAAVDRTVTGAGARLLTRRLAGPSTNPDVIANRLDAITWMLADTARRTSLRESLAAAPDLARALSRLSLDRGGPRDLAAIRDGLDLAMRIAERIADGDTPPEEIAKATAKLRSSPRDLVDVLTSALADELPHLKRDGGFVRERYSADLDEARNLRDESRKVVAGLQADYAAETDIRALRIKHNNVLGYFIEVASSHGERLLGEPLNARFIHRQTMAGALRFTTTELADLDARISGAGERALASELTIFEDLVATVTKHAVTIREIAEALAVLDVASGLATLAEAEDWCRPQVEPTLAFSIEGGRHPVVEQALRAEGSGSFVANDADLGAREDDDAGLVWLVTGPNMAGKSTFLRQNALIAILAQSGSYVPARSARIGIVDRLFSRVGAADDLARGRSTFMVEMVETAAILNQASPRSLVILDEIGRGTATFDGLSIAWAAIEYLHEVNRSRALFATHYHELTALTERLPRLRNVTVRVKEWKGDVIFLHEIAAGAADRSYGIQVAKLAGLPASVVARARTVLSQLEETDRKSPVTTLIDELPLFSAAMQRSAGQEEPGDDVLAAMLDAILPDEMTPREALEALYKLKTERARRQSE
jgi:DNA mismatch repair protein MutS